MTPQSLVIDRSFRGVGRIKKATGSTIPGVRKKMNKMLDELVEERRLDILRSIRDGHLTLSDVLSAYNKKDLDSLATGTTAKRLVPTMRAWIDTLVIPTDASEKHAYSLLQATRYFEKVNARATVADLPDVLEELRNTLGKEHPRSFNITRAAALSFVRSTLKRSHPIWLKVSAVEIRKVPKTQKRRPITPDVMRNLFPNPETDHVDAIAWGMVTTGMGNAEYFGKWSVESDRIHVFGTKRAGRDRDIPLVATPAVPRIHHRTFEDKVRERTTIITPYDLRRTYANWMESSGIPRNRRKMYLGHGAKDVTDLYERSEVTAYLVEDAGKIRAFLGLPHTKLHTIAIHKERHGTA